MEKRIVVCCDQVQRKFRVTLDASKRGYISLSAVKQFCSNANGIYFLEE